MVASVRGRWRDGGHARGWVIRALLVPISLLSILGLFGAVPAVAQSAARDTLRAGSRASHRATPFLPPGHWAFGAARRLEAAGLAPEGFGGGMRSRTERELALLFETAELHAELNAPELAPLARAYRLRFAEEFPHALWFITRDQTATGWEVLGGRARVGYELHRGRIQTGVGYDPATDWTGTLPLPDRRHSVNVLSAGVAIAPRLALSVTPANRGGRWALEGAHLNLSHGPLGLWLGRRAVGFHPGLGGGIVLTGTHSFDGGGLFLDGPVDLPWVLRYLGPVRFDFFLTRIDNGDRIERPWFGAMYGTLQPHPRLELGVARGNIFGGRGNTPTTFGSLVQMLFGFHAGEGGEYNNEVFAAHLRLRPPVGELPLVVYLEWGMDDSAGAWFNVPARVAGIEIAALPGLPVIALGAERTSFAGACCGNTIWYRNWSLRGGWAASGRPLGHPLAGQGEEWLLYSRADLYEARLNLDLRLFARERGPENLFAPERHGRSRGGSLALEGRVGQDLALFLQGALERGAGGWREEALSAGVQIVF